MSDGEVGKVFLESRHSEKARQSEERVSVATKLEQLQIYTSDLTFTWFFQPKIFFFNEKELFDHLFGFYSYHFIIKLVWPTYGFGSTIF